MNESRPKITPARKSASYCAVSKEGAQKIAEMVCQELTADVAKSEQRHFGMGYARKSSADSDYSSTEDKSIFQYDDNGNFLKQPYNEIPFVNLRKAPSETNVSVSSSITSSRSMPEVPVNLSNRRLLGKKRFNAAVSASPQRLEQLRREHDSTKTSGDLKRVPSSLFYLQYDEQNKTEQCEDEKKKRMPRIQRKISGTSTISRKSSDASISETLDRVVLHSQELTKELSSRKNTKLVNYYVDSMRAIDEVLKGFRLRDSDYEDLMVRLKDEMLLGLSKNSNHLATIKMYPTYVRCLPSGREFGRFLALDLGGTNFRVLLVELNGTDQPKISSKVGLISFRLMMGSGQQLFDHIAECIAEFVQEQHLQNDLLPLGFTFSFPCIQKTLSTAILSRWTKGFCCEGVEGHNVGQLLREAVERRRDLNVECVAIICDSVGVLATGAYKDEHCKIGIILGTGTNCCYMEHLKRVELWDGDHNEPAQVAINTEWGAFGDNGILDIIRTSFDRTLDEQSLNKGHQVFEKMISGMYLGELVRLVLCQLTSSAVLFNGQASEQLLEPKRFYTKYLSEIESDDINGNFPKTKLVLQELDIDNYSLDDCRYVQHVCWQISQRAAFLSAAAVATVIEHLDMPKVTIAVDGSLYRFHPHFSELMKRKISQLISSDKQFKIILAQDGSGQGAALVTAVALQLS